MIRENDDRKGDLMETSTTCSLDKMWAEDDCRFTDKLGRRSQEEQVVSL